MTTQNKIKILIADDQVALLDGLEMLLNKCGFDVIKKVYRADDVPRTYTELKPDVLICDVLFDQKKGSTSGLDVLKTILEEDEHAKIILYSQFDNKESMNQSYKLGAMSYLTKNFEHDELIAAINSAAKGEVYFTKSIAIEMATLNLQTTATEKAPSDVLSGRLYDVFILTAKGKTQPEIAEELGVHHRTITTDIKHMKNLLGIHNPAELTALAIKFDLIDIENIKIVKG